MLEFILLNCNKQKLWQAHVHLNTMINIFIQYQSHNYLNLSLKLLNKRIKRKAFLCEVSTILMCCHNDLLYAHVQFFWLFPWGDSYLLPPYYVIFKILFDYLKFCLKFYMTILIKSIKTSILWVSDCNQFKYYHLSIKYSCYRLQIPMNFHKFNKVPTLENLNPLPYFKNVELFIVGFLVGSRWQLNKLRISNFSSFPWRSCNQRPAL